MRKVVIRESPAWGESAIVVLDGGHGVAIVSRMKGSPEVAVIHDLVVHEGKRGHGLGNTLLREATDEARAMGAEVVRVSVEADGWQVDWYRRHGFMLVDVASLFDCPCYVMQKNLP